MVNIDKGYDYFQEAYAVLEKTGTIDHCVIKAGLPYERVKAEMVMYLIRLFYAYCESAQRRSGKDNQ